MIVTSLIQSVSRCSVAGSPCTPMLAMCPPARASETASSKVAGVPTASIETSAPSPSVSAEHDVERVLVGRVHDDVGAELLRGVEPAVGEIDRDDVARAVQPRAHDRGQADRAGADDATTSPGATCPLSTPTS